MATRPKAPPKAPDIDIDTPEERAEPVALATQEDQEAAAAFLVDDAAVQPVIVKLARIMGSLPQLQAEGRNQHFGYSFIKDTQISGALRPRFAKERLMVIPDVLKEEWFETRTSKGGISYVTKLSVQFTIIDGDSGTQISGVGIGYGDDSGDKGANKALTAAMKYWLMKLFQIGGEDNEADASADKRAAERQEGPSQVKIEGKKIEGVERGGQSVRITQAQMKQLFSLYKDLALTPDAFALRIDQYLGDQLAIDDAADVTAQLNAYIKTLTADDAGKLITAMIDEKDAKRDAAADGPVDEAADAPE